MPTKEKSKKEEAPEEQPEKNSGDKSKSRDNKGQFVKGRKKTGGRQLGTKNRNSNVRDRLKEQVEPFVDNIAEMLMQVKKEEGTKEMLYLMEKFMPYFMPKYSALTLGSDQDRPISEEQRLLELDAKYTKKELSINYNTMVVVNNDKPKGDADPDEDYSLDLSQLEKLSEE